MIVQKHFSIRYNKTSFFLEYHHGVAGWVIGIVVVGVLIFLALVIVLPLSIYCCCYKRRSTPGAMIQQPTMVGHQMPAPMAGQQMAVAMQVSTAPNAYNAPMYAVYNPATGQVTMPTAGAVAPQPQPAPAPVQQDPAPAYDNLAFKTEEPSKTKF